MQPRECPDFSGGPKTISNNKKSFFLWVGPTTPVSFLFSFFFSVCASKQWLAQKTKSTPCRGPEKRDTPTHTQLTKAKGAAGPFSKFAFDPSEPLLPNRLSQTLEECPPVLGGLKGNQRLHLLESPVGKIEHISSSDRFPLKPTGKK